MKIGRADTLTVVDVLRELAAARRESPQSRNTV
jgi:hypothetical protein